MRSIEQACMIEGANGTSVSVGTQNAGTKNRLMKTLLGLPHDVTSQFFFNRRSR